MRLVALLAPLALISPALADGASIVDALTTVDSSTVKLGSAVRKWRGDILGTLPILAENTALLVHVKQGTKTAEESAPLDLPATLNVAGATNNLTASVNATMTALIAAKPKFDRLLLSPLIHVNLGLQKRATAEMSDAIIDKVPVELQALARTLVAPISASFDKVLSVYGP